MRLKQLLGIVLLASASALAAATVSQLGGVLVKNQDSAAVITILANGTFTHTEYRPTDNLMLVDLAGVSIAHQDAKVHEVVRAGSAVLPHYRLPVRRRRRSGAHGADAGAGGQGQRQRSGRRTGVACVSGIARRRAGQKRSGRSAGIQKAGAATRIREISVARGSDALNIEISGSGPMTARTMKLTHPDRVVVDIPNSVLQGRAREIPVNSSDVKSVRAARYQEGTTRVVVDMAQMRDFQVVPEGNKLVVRLSESSSGQARAAARMKETVVTADAPRSNRRSQAPAVPSEPGRTPRRVRPQSRRKDRGSHAVAV